MTEPAFHQSLRKLGAILHTQDLILKLGRAKLGEPTKRQTNRLLLTVDLERLDRIAVKVLTAKSWDALLRVK